MKSKKKNAYVGVITFLALVIFFMAFSTGNQYSGDLANNQLLEMQLVQLLAQENALLVDGSVAMGKLDFDKIINSCSVGIADSLIDEGV